MGLEILFLYTHPQGRRSIIKLGEAHNFFSIVEFYVSINQKISLLFIELQKNKDGQYKKKI